MPRSRTSACAAPASASRIPRSSRASSRSLERSVANRNRSSPASLDGQSFDAIVLPHLDAAHRLARWLARDKQDAEDIVQESSMRAFRYFRTFTGGNGRAWFLCIVRNTCWNWQRGRAHALNDPFDEERHSSAESSADPETLLMQ